jgi:hypothetical protein
MKMKKEYTKPVVCVEELYCSGLLVNSNSNPYDQDSQDPMQKYTGDDDTLYDDDEVI